MLIIDFHAHLAMRGHLQSEVKTSKNQNIGNKIES